MGFDRNFYIGKRIVLFPESSDRIIGKIVDVDSLGWTIRIVEVDKQRTDYKADYNYFFSHSAGLVFQIIGV